MPASGTPKDAVRGWLGLSGRIETALEGLAEKDLDLRGGEEGWSIRETVHHLVEANLVASNVLIAGLAKSPSVYDWSWVNPGEPWMKRLAYDRAPVRPALEALRALSVHLAGIIRASSDGLERRVRLLDTPGARPYPSTIRALLTREIDHAEEHLRTIAEIRASHGR